MILHNNRTKQCNIDFDTAYGAGMWLDIRNYDEKQVASTLGGNARFISSGGMQCAKDATVEWVIFENVDFISDKAIPGGGYEIATNTNTGYGGRQVVNENGTNSTLKCYCWIQFVECYCCFG